MGAATLIVRYQKSKMPVLFGHRLPIDRLLRMKIIPRWILRAKGRSLPQLHPGKRHEKEIFQRTSRGDIVAKEYPNVDGEIVYDFT